MTKRGRTILIMALKVAVAAALLFYLIHSGKLERGTFEPVFDRWGYLAAAFLLFAGVPLIGALRWYILLRCQDFKVGFWRALHLTLVGIFFNCFSVGLTGGDLVKAYYAAFDQPRGRRAEAIYTVGFDRAVGLFALVLMGTLALLTRPAQVMEDAGYRTTVLVMCGLTVFVAFGFLFMFSSRFRESKTIGPKLEKMVGGRLFLRFYRTIKIYRTKPGAMLAAIALSCGAHILTFGGIWQIGKALGIPIGVTAADFVFCVAVGLTISAFGLPLGIGLGQWSFGELFGRQVAQGGYQFGTALATVHQAVMLVFNLALGLPAFLSVRREMARIQAEIREDQEAEAQGEAASEAPPEPAPQSEADV